MDVNQGMDVFRHLNDYYGLPTGTKHKFWKQFLQK